MEFRHLVEIILVQFNFEFSTKPHTVFRFKLRNSRSISLQPINISERECEIILKYIFMHILVVFFFFKFLVGILTLIQKQLYSVCRIFSVHFLVLFFSLFFFILVFLFFFNIIFFDIFEKVPIFCQQTSNPASQMKCEMHKFSVNYHKFQFKCGKKANASKLFFLFSFAFDENVRDRNALKPTTHYSSEK